MRLLSTTVRSYRVHREITVDLDGARTVIGGPNESGKSTLIEAIHRCLFLKATVTGEPQLNMESTCHPGHPEVEVRFEAHGAEYQVAKRFSGPGGTCRLTRTGGGTWQGEEAESRLAALLGVDSAGGGKGILERVKKQWAHLWVWQGQSSDDVGEHIESQHAGVLRQLQQIGGAVAMQSDLDGRVASRFSQSKDQIFTLAGNPKRGSDLERALAESQQAEAVHAGALARLEDLRQAVVDFEAASSTIQRATADLEELSRQQQEVKEKISRVEELRRAEENQTSALAGLLERLATLEGVEKSISELRASVGDLQRALEPKVDRQRRLESKLADVRRSKGEADQAYDQALVKTREVRLARELAAAYVTCFEKEARRLELDARLKRVEGLQKELDQIRGQCAGLVLIDQAGLERLQALENDLARATAAVSAMATEVEVMTADQVVQVGEARLTAGESQTVSDLTEVLVGDGVRLRIHPGGGDSLAEARERVRALQQELQRALDGQGLRSIAQAAEMVARKAALKSRQEATEAALRQWDAEDLVIQHRQVEAESTSVRAEIDRRRGEMAGVDAPETLAEAQAWLDRETGSLRIVESDETGRKTTLDALAKQVTDREHEANDSRDEIEGERQILTGLSAQLDLLIGNHGDDESRARALGEVLERKTTMEGQVARTRRTLEALQPVLLEADRDRLQRAWDETDRQRREAETRAAVSQAILRSDGEDDPNVVQAQAQARMEAAAEHREAVRRKSDAIALVDDLFKREQQALADQFSQPLAERVTAYLQCLFGPEARAEVTFENNTFKGIRLIRPAAAGAECFDCLSEGAREQVAAAVRLAIAELLAADQDGSLPVVFDDAFAYSDPERVSTLQRMLDLGAARGLQIIVLTCNPSDYAGLGARQVSLS